MCGAGFIIWYKNIKLYSGSEFISENNTNNFAEYYALLIALKKCNELNIKNIIIKSDSEFVTKKLTTVEFIDIESYNNLDTSIELELNNFKSYKIIHISCEKNKDANNLANKAITDFIVTKLHNKSNNSYIEC